MRTLDQEEITEVEEILKERHPLYYEGLKLNDVYPFLNSVPGCKKAVDIKVGESNPKETDRILGTDIERSDDPHMSQEQKAQDEKTKKSLQILGFGTVGYFDFHLYLMILYVIIVILLLPSLYLFLFYGDGRKLGSSFLNKFSIGNLGFSSAECKDVTLQVGNLQISCPTAEIRQIVSFGVIPSDGKVNDACWPNDETSTCAGVYDEASTRAKIEELCLGKPHCTIPAKSFITGQGRDECKNTYAQFYTQVYCEFSEEEIGDRDKLSIWFSVQIMLTTIAFIAFLMFLKWKTSREYTSWDVETTTISDYTMKYQIPRKIFDDFKKNIYPTTQHIQENGMLKLDQNPNENVIYAFKCYLKNEFEEILRNSEHVKFADESLVEISHIHLNFNHVQLQHMLEDRGAAIKVNNVDKKAKIEKDITEYCKTNKDTLCVPREAYIIFETEEAFHRAMKLNSVKQCGREMATKEWKGTNLILENIIEPSNIHFENKFKSRIVTAIKLVIVSFILFIALCCTCMAIFYFQTQVNRLNRQYPLVDCGIVVADSSDEMLVNLAMIEYYNYETSDKSDKTILMQNTDNLQCYCDTLASDIGYLTAYRKEFDVEVLDEHITGKVCNNYLKSAIFIQLTSLILPILIIVFNLALKMLAIFLIQWLKFENKTIEI